MADDKTTKTPEQPVTDSGPGKETPPNPPKEPEKVSVCDPYQFRRRAAVLREHHHPVC